MSVYLKTATEKYHEKYPYDSYSVGWEFCEFIEELVKHLDGNIIVDADPKYIRTSTITKWYATLHIDEDDLDFYFANKLAKSYKSGGEWNLGPRHPEVMIERALDRLDTFHWGSAKSFVTFILQTFIDMDREQVKVYLELSNTYENYTYTGTRLVHDYKWFARRFDIFNPNPDNESYDQREIDIYLLEDLDSMFFDDPVDDSDDE